MEGIFEEKRLRKYRRGAGLTQRELARLAVVSRASISHAECGRTKVSITLARKICRALSAHVGRPLRLNDVFPGEYPPPPDDSLFNFAFPSANQDERHQPQV